MLLLAALLAAPAGDPLLGTWRGTSTCQVRPSACNDEGAVYRISAAGANRYTMVMDKVVGGVEGFMGTLDLTYDPAAHRLSAVTYDRQKRPGGWAFTLDGNAMHGTLTVGGTIYRRIELTRDRG